MKGRASSYVIWVLLLAGLPLLFSSFVFGGNVGMILFLAGAGSSPLAITIIALKGQNDWYLAKRRWVYLGLTLLGAGFSTLVFEVIFGTVELYVYSILAFLVGASLLLQLLIRSSRYPTKGGKITLDASQISYFAIWHYRLTDEGILRTKVSTVVHPLIYALALISVGFLLEFGLSDWFLSPGNVVLFSTLGVPYIVLLLSLSRKRRRVAALSDDELRKLKASKLIPWSIVSQAQLKGIVLMISAGGKKFKMSIGGSSDEAVREFVKSKINERFVSG